MIAQNEINVQVKLVIAKPCKYCTGRILVKSNNGDYSIPDSRGETHLTSLCNKWTKPMPLLIFSMSEQHQHIFFIEGS